MEDDEVTLSLDGKNLANLRVVDLKLELEKRGLSKSGSKKSLVKRLKTQLEFEKLCEERKTTGDCDLKKELDAATEQNEFVQRYLAQQQKIFAEQKEVKRLVELEETQKRNEGVSPHAEENQSTEESDTEEDDINDSDKNSEKIESKEKTNLETDKKSVPVEKLEEECLSKIKNVACDNIIQTTKEDELNKDLVQKNELEKAESAEKEAKDKIILISKKEDTINSPEKANKVDTPVKSSTFENEPICKKKVNLNLTLKISNDGYTSSVKGNDEESTSFKTDEKSCKSAINTTTENVVVTDQSDKILEQKPDAIHNVEQSDLNQSDKLNLNFVVSNEPIDVSDIPFPPDSNFEKCALEKKSEMDSASSIPCESEVLPLKSDDSVEICTSKTVETPNIAGISTSLIAKTSVVDHNKSEGKMDQNVPYLLSDIQLPESSTNIETSEKIVSQKDGLSPDIVKEEEVSESCVNPDCNTQSNGVSSLKETKECLKSDLVTNKSSNDKDLKQNSFILEKKKSNDKEIKVQQVKSKNKSLENKSSLKPSLENKNSSKSESKSRKKEPVKKYDSSESEKESDSKSSSSSDESSRSEEDNRRRSSRRKSSPKLTHRKRASSTDSQSSESRTSSPEKSSSPENREKKKDSKRSTSPDMTKNVKILKHPEVSPNVLEANTVSSKDPPRKKLKINRNNVIIPSVPEDSSEAPNSLKTHKTVPEKSTKPLDEKSSSEEHHDPDSPPQSSEETVEREMGEIIENYPEIKYEPRKLNFPGRKQSRLSTDDPTSEMPKTKKSKWGKFASRKTSQTINISTDSLKNWFPDFKLVNEPVPVTEISQEDSPVVKEDKKSNFTLNIENDIDINQDKKITQNAVHNSVPESSSIENTEPSTPVSKIVFIQNLVRPFTLLQLKEFLRQNGNLIEEQFWIDKIKSKCFATYETEEEAVKSRNAINGTRWPASNPKILSAEFSTEEEFELHRSGADTQKVTLDTLPPVQESYESKTSQSTHTADHRKREADKRRERERYRMQAPMREWDKDKLLQESPERNTIGKDSEGHRLSDKKDRKDTKKKANEDTPAKLLDDLFQKTKSAPCIYWLPLTEIQVTEREEALRQRKLEREKRQQQREQEDSEHRKRPRTDHKSRDAESRRSSTRSRSPTSRRR